MNNLEKQIESARKTVHVDSYPMSIGELINLYKDGDLRIQPEFQRLFRWKPWQKSNFIESILLGIPIPSVFVAQQSNGKWDVVDGLQRISTILEFLGLLRGSDEQLLPPLELSKTKYLPDLDGKVSVDNTIDEEDLEKSYETRLIHPNIIRAFKREKIDLKIIKKESNKDAKLELFQRLNTGGSKLSEQEVRNCLLLMINPTAFEWLQDICKDQNFQSTLSISTTKDEESYSTELLLKYFSLRYFSEDEIAQHRDVHPYLDAFTQRIFNPDSHFDYSHEKLVFEKTFEIFNQVLGEKSFKKFNCEQNDFKGAFSTPVFECLSFAVSNYISNGIANFDSVQFKKLLEIKAKELPQKNEFLEAERVRPIDKTKKMRELGAKLFNE